MITNVPLPSIPGVDVQERHTWTISGPIGLLEIVVAVGLITLRTHQAQAENLPPGPVLTGVGAVLLTVLASGLYALSPGEARVLESLSSYISTVRKPDLRFVAPFVAQKKTSVEVRSSETRKPKVDNADGDLIDIAAIVVRQVADTTRVKHVVGDHIDLVYVQSEVALRHIAMNHPYDSQDTTITLYSDTEVIAKEMADEVTVRTALAGLRIVETRIPSLVYTSEIVQAMLQRQQVAAIITAREKIAKGAVSMVQDVLNQLETADVVVLDDERHATMVSDLLMMLCGSS